MCGINGFTFSDPDALRRMHLCTKHRGPDQEGFYAEGVSAFGGETSDISLAHNRLSIIDLSEGGRQPMRTPDGRYTIVFNGEIYNYQEIKSELEMLGESFISKSDTEVLLHAWAKWGNEALPKLNGIYAFAIWDEQEKSLILARDSMGTKPLYYYHDSIGKRLIFSSEIKAILTHGMKREVDPVAFSLYARMMYVPGERTMFKGIKKLPQGSFGIYQSESFEIKPWFEISRKDSINSYQEAVEGVRIRTVDAVRRQLVSDRPLGVFLSGGIDSTAVLGIMRDLQPSGIIKTFTIGYDSKVDSEKFNADAKIAKKSAEHFNAEHHQFILSAQDTIDHMEKVVWHMDEPIANHIQPSTFLIAKYAKPEITVALGGDGGDELFAGYPRYWYLQNAPALLSWMPRSIARPLSDRFKIIQKLTAKTQSEKFRLYQGLNEDRSRLLISKDNLNLSEDHGKEAMAMMLENVFSQIGKHDDETSDFLEADLRTWLPDESLVRTDKLSMAHALEARVPLLDLELVKYAFRIPSKFKLGTKEQGKKVFIDAMRPFLPEHTLKEKKRGWMSPSAKWIREEPMLSWVKEVLSPSYAPGSEEFLDFDGLERILDQHLKKEVYGLHELWLAITFQIWYRQFILSL